MIVDRGNLWWNTMEGKDRIMKNHIPSYDAGLSGPVEEFVGFHSTGVDKKNTSISSRVKFCPVSFERGCIK